MTNKKEASKIKVHVILGSTREGRMGEPVFKWFQSIARKRSDIDFGFIDLKKENLPILYNETPPSSGKYPDNVNPWAKKVASADAFVIVTPEYNHGYPGVLKNAFDLIYTEWNNKPISFVGYGGMSGGIRAVEQLSLVARELQMAPIREAVHIQFVWEAFDEKGNLKNAEFYEKKANAMLDQLVEWASSMHTLRK